MIELFLFLSDFKKHNLTYLFSEFYITNGAAAESDWWEISNPTLLYSTKAYCNQRRELMSDVAVDKSE